MILIFVALSAARRLAAVAPSVAIAAVIGTIIAIVSGQLGGGILADGVIASPVFTAPEFSLAAMAELVIPLTIILVIVQNGQGIAVLQAAGHKPGGNGAGAVSGQVSMRAAVRGQM